MPDEDDVLHPSSEDWNPVSPSHHPLIVVSPLEDKDVRCQGKLMQLRSLSFRNLQPGIMKESSGVRKGRWEGVVVAEWG